METIFGFVVAAWLVSANNVHEPIPFATLDDCRNAWVQLVAKPWGDSRSNFGNSVCVATGAPEPLPANIPPEALR